MTAIGRLVKLVAWLRSGTGSLGSIHDMRDAADDVEWLIKDHVRLTDIARAARRLDAALCEFGSNPAYIADLSQPLHDLLHASPRAGELVIEKLPSRKEGSP